MGVIDQGGGTFECEEHGYVVFASSWPSDNANPVPQSEDYHEDCSSCNEVIQRAMDLAQREQQG